MKKKLNGNEMEQCWMKRASVLYMEQAGAAAASNGVFLVGRKWNFLPQLPDRRGPAPPAITRSSIDVADAYTKQASTSSNTGCILYTLQLLFRFDCFFSSFLFFFLQNNALFFPRRKELDQS
jgi:hypothetical protein